MTAENDVYHSILVKYARRKFQKLFLGLGLCNTAQQYLSLSREMKSLRHDIKYWSIGADGNVWDISGISEI